MPCWDELKSLRAQSVGEVMRAIFSICGNESQAHRRANSSPKVGYAPGNRDKLSSKYRLQNGLRHMSRTK